MTEGQELERNQIALLSGPRNESNALRGILERMKAKLTSKNYDNHYLAEQAKDIHQRVHRKFDKFYDAKLKFCKPAPSLATMRNQTRKANKTVSPDHASFKRDNSGEELFDKKRGHLM